MTGIPKSKLAPLQHVPRVQEGTWVVFPTFGSYCHSYCHSYTHQPKLHRWVCFAQSMMIMMAENPPFVADFPPWNPPFSHPLDRVLPSGPCFHLSPGERMAGVGCLLQRLRTWKADQRALLGEVDHRLREQNITTAWAKWRFSSLVVPVYRWMV